MKVYSFVATGFEETELIYVVDILRRAKIDVEIISVEKDLLVKSSHNITIKADRIIDDVDLNDGDAIFLPGGMPGVTNLLQSEKLMNGIKEYNKSNKWLCAICAAPVVLAQAFALEDKKATVYPGFEKDLILAHIQNKGVYVSKNVITATAVSYAEELALTMVEEFVSTKARMEVESAIITH